MTAKNTTVYSKTFLYNQIINYAGRFFRVKVSFAIASGGMEDF